ncbi:unnamed protein product [Trichogramma brassicae]|uniref:Uncharacterized protein n=2 Tax=Trichogramma brassicae TaxID=86971 RepID=A0A6H5HXZ8_9HYME|nr:unnamed protein product [Trichogramma brassicae]
MAIARPKKEKNQKAREKITTARSKKKKKVRRVREKIIIARPKKKKKVRRVCEKIIIARPKKKKVQRVREKIRIARPKKKYLQETSRRRCRVNAQDSEDKTPLHIALVRVKGKYHESLHDILQELDLEAQDASDRASLRVTVVDESKRSVELLLKAGADPNVTDAEGSTALHVICRRDDDNDNLMKMLFKICDDLEMPVDVDAQDNLRNTPLHLALAGGHIALTEVLLKQRADPNVANDEREIPLHVICHRKIDDDLMKVFFELCKELEKKVQINVQNELNQTPLQLAVKYLMPDVLYALLTYSTTDLPSFVFPSAADFKQYLNIKISESTRNRSFKSQVICDAIFVIRHLWANGSELEVIEAPAIITLLINHVWFAMSENLIKKIFNDKYFAMEAKRIAVSQSRSLYELMKLPINKAARLFNYKDFKSTLSRRGILFKNI